MKNLTYKERLIVLAAVRLWQVNARGGGYVPDYALVNPDSELPVETMRDIRDLVQEEAAR